MNDLFLMNKYNTYKKVRVIPEFRINKKLFVYTYVERGNGIKVEIKRITRSLSVDPALGFDLA